jgi:hypothetical protein
MSDEDYNDIVLKHSPAPSGKVFVLATPQHMLHKLHWEIYNLRKALTERPEHLGHMHAPSYCAFNCAVTAWHLSDWTWQASTSEQRAFILSCIDTDANKNDFGKLQAYLRDNSRALYICRQIATGSKHVKIEKYDDPDIRAETRLESEPARVGEMRAGDRLAVHRYRLSLFDKGTERPALDVFEEAYKDWEGFLATWGLVEGARLVPAPSRSRMRQAR